MHSQIPPQSDSLHKTVGDDEDEGKKGGEIREGEEREEQKEAEEEEDMQHEEEDEEEEQEQSLSLIPRQSWEERGQ